MSTDTPLSQPKTSLQRQMTITLSIIIVSLLLLVSLPMVYISVEIQREESAREQQELANRIADAVSFIIGSIETSQSQTSPPEQENPRINLIATQITSGVNLVASRALSQIQSAVAENAPLYTILNDNPQIVGIAHFNTNGRLTETQQNDTNLIPVLTNLNQTESFDLARQGLNAQDTLFTDPDSTPLLVIAAPVIGENSVTGVVMALMNIESIWQYITDLNVGEDGYLYIISQNGSPIILPGQTESASVSPDVRRNIENNQSYQGLSGQQVIGKLAAIENTPWNAVIEIPSAEANRSLRSLLIILGAILMFGVSLSISVARLFSGWILQPIQVLHQSALRISRGDLSHRIELDRTDELGFLASAFNQMVDTLEKTIEELRTVSLRLLSAEEEERKRIAHEIHDELGQTLTALKFTASMARRNPAEAEANLIAVQEMASEAQEKARTLSHELRPAMLDELGLLPTLEWYIDRFEQRANLAISLETNINEESLPHQISSTLYRLFVEALTNIYKHANASAVEIFITQNQTHLHMVIIDDGQGFNAAILGGSESLGLAGMRERVNLLRGDFLLESEPGQGTRIFIALPLDE